MFTCIVSVLDSINRSSFVAHAFGAKALLPSLLLGLGDSFVHLEVPVAQVVLVLGDVTDFELQAPRGDPGWGLLMELPGNE